MSWISVCQQGDVSEDELSKLKEKKLAYFLSMKINRKCLPSCVCLINRRIYRTVECPLHEAIFDIQTGELGPGVETYVRTQFVLKDRNSTLVLTCTRKQNNEDI